MKETVECLKIGNKIKKWREIRNFSQEYMASKLDMSQANYSRIETDQIDIQLNVLQKITQILDVTIEDILRFDPKYFFNNTNFNSSTFTGNIQSPSNVEGDIKNLKAQIDLLTKAVLKLSDKL